MTCKKCDLGIVVQDKCNLCGWVTPRGRVRRVLGFLALAINTALAIIALGFVFRGIQKLFLLGWRLF